MTLRKVQAEQLDLASENSPVMGTLDLADTILVSDDSELGKPSKVTTIQQVVDIVGGNLSGPLNYVGTWTASTNTPTLVVSPGAPSKGDYYVVVGATTTVFGISWSAGDWIVSNGTVWEKIDNTDSVTSVASKTGVVTLVKADVGLSNVDDTSDVNKPVSTATQTALNGKANTSTTLAGYGITDATPSSHVGSGGVAHSNAIAAGAAGFMTGTDKTKLDGVAIGATANSADAYLLSRTNHTGTQVATTISDFSEAVDDRVAALLIEGNNVDYVYTDGSNTFSIAVNDNPVWTGTSHERMITGTTAQRPVSPVNGDSRYNSTLNRDEIYKGAWTPFGKVLQVVAGDIAVATITATTPAFNNTTPASTDGTAIWSTSFTPLKSTSKILIMFSLWNANSNNGRTATGIVNYGGAVLNSFVDATENSARPSMISYIKQHLPGNTTTVTVEARMGTPGGNTLYINQGSTQTMGGTGTSSYMILEIEA